VAGKYACFKCGGEPELDRVEKELEDRCPLCSVQYGLPKFHPPTEVRQFRDLEYVGRGFYAATYRATAGNLGKEYVLKVAPASVYARFGKSFEEESKAHFRVAEDSEHLVNIFDNFNEKIAFGDVAVDCHVAVLEYVKGETLQAFFDNAGADQAGDVSQLRADVVAQIDID
jgi:serine/threonine protein kinase